MLELRPSRHSCVGCLSWHPYLYLEHGVGDTGLEDRGKPCSCCWVGCSSPSFVENNKNTLVLDLVLLFEAVKKKPVWIIMINNIYKTWDLCCKVGAWRDNRQSTYPSRTYHLAAGTDCPRKHGISGQQVVSTAQAERTNTAEALSGGDSFMSLKWHGLKLHEKWIYCVT